ncbi:MAG: hypothetical protein WDM70_06320 [Nitrosomonadales bacterium]
MAEEHCEAGWGIVDGKADQVTADLALADVQTQLADGLAPLNLRSLHGRIGWIGSDQGMEIFIAPAYVANRRRDIAAY